MPFETILLAVADEVATVTLNRPEVMNGLNAAMRREITQAVDGSRGAGRGWWC